MMLNFELSVFQLFLSKIINQNPGQTENEK